MRILSLVLLGALFGQAQAAWKLDNGASSLFFVSTKNEHITETHSFKELTGELSDGGALIVSVALASVDTGIGVRDTRMKEKLFKVADVPTATLTASLDPRLLKMAEGKSIVTQVEAELTLNDTKASVPIEVRVSKLDDRSLLATTTKPVVLNANQFDLGDGIRVLQDLAGLASISLSVPVTFSVVFSPAS